MFLKLTADWALVFDSWGGGSNFDLNFIILWLQFDFSWHPPCTFPSGKVPDILHVHNFYNLSCAYWVYMCSLLKFKWTITCSQLIIFSVSDPRKYKSFTVHYCNQLVQLFRSAHTMGLVPATSPLKGLHETGPRELTTESVLRNKSHIL